MRTSATGTTRSAIILLPCANQTLLYHPRTLGSPPLEGGRAGHAGSQRKGAQVRRGAVSAVHRACSCDSIALAFLSILSVLMLQYLCPSQSSASSGFGRRSSLSCFFLDIIPELGWAVPDSSDAKMMVDGERGEAPLAPPPPDNQCPPMVT